MAYRSRSPVPFLFATIVILALLYWWGGAQFYMALLSSPLGWLVTTLGFFLIWYPGRRLFTYFEIMDHPKAPSWITGAVQEVLLEMWFMPLPVDGGSAGGILVKHIVSRLRSLPGVQELATLEFLDLASGAGGPYPRMAIAIADQLGKNVKVTLSDLNPHVESWKAVADDLSRSNCTIAFAEEPVDATKVSPDLPGIRTINASFHHLPPSSAKALIQSAIDCDQPLIISDPKPVMPMIFYQGPMAVHASLYWVYRKFKEGKGLSACIKLPAVILILMHDGTASVLRSYSADQIRKMILDCEGHERFRWIIETYASGGLITYGLPNTWFSRSDGTEFTP